MMEWIEKVGVGLMLLSVFLSSVVDGVSDSLISLVILVSIFALGLILFLVF
jgi:hypothetical protein